MSSCRSALVGSLRARSSAISRAFAEQGGSLGSGEARTESLERDPILPAVLFVAWVFFRETAEEAHLLPRRLDQLAGLGERLVESHTIALAQGEIPSGVAVGGRPGRPRPSTGRAPSRTGGRSR